PRPLLMASSRRTIALVVAGLLLAVVPPIAALTNQPFYVDLFRRMMIFAIAAVSLDLILGYGGMVSFGHAAYLGIGAYAVGIPAFYGVDNGWLQWGLAIAASALAATVIGAISLRTSGVSFIMITLAFAQMLYYLGISLETYGGDNGMRLSGRSRFGGPLDLREPAIFYYVVLAILVLFLALGADRALADHPRADPDSRGAVRQAWAVRPPGRRRAARWLTRCWRSAASASASGACWRATGSTSTSPGARRTRSSAPTARARPRSSASSRATFAPTPARSALPTRT